MTVNERIKLLRKELNLSQAKFAKAISISNGYIAGIELGNRSVNERIIKLISTEFNVREEWLRDGIEPKSNASDTFSLDEYAKQRQVSDLELDIIKLYFELDPDTRRGLLKHFKDGLLKDKPKVESEKDDEEKDSSPPRVAEKVKEYSCEELSAKERGEQEYIKNVLKSAPKPVVSASSGTEDISKVV